MRYWLLVGLLLLLGAGCSSGDEQGLQSNLPEEVQETEIEDGAENIFLERDEVVAMAENDSAGITRDVVAGPRVIEMSVDNFFFDPGDIQASPGEELSLFFGRHVGNHTFVIDDLGIKRAVTQGDSITFRAPEIPGHYRFYCDEGSHAELGMEGTIVVK